MPGPAGSVDLSISTSLRLDTETHQYPCAENTATQCSVDGECYPPVDTRYRVIARDPGRSALLGLLGRPMGGRPVSGHGSFRRERTVHANRIRMPNRITHKLTAFMRSP